MANGNVDINTGDVRATLAKVAQTYATLTEHIAAMNTKRGEVSSVWQSSSATQFETDLAKVATSFDNFNTKYSAILTSLNNITSSTDELRDSHASAYGQYAGSTN